MKLNQIVVLILFITVGLSACGKKLTEDELWQQAGDFEKQEKYDEAIHAYEKFVRDFPASKQADAALQKEAFLYYNNINDYYKAIECHNRLLAKYPESQFATQASFMIGFIYANDLKDYDKAEAAYKQFLESYPESELVESVKWELDHLGQDVNEQLINLFGQEESNGATQTN